MKVVVAGISGNQGKSTLSAHMLVPRMNGAKLLVVGWGFTLMQPSKKVQQC